MYYPALYHKALAPGFVSFDGLWTIRLSTLSSLLGHSVIFWSCLNRVLQTCWLPARDICAITVLEAKGLTASYSQDHDPQGLLVENLSWPTAGIWRLPSVLNDPWLLNTWLQSLPISTWPLPVCLCISPAGWTPVTLGPILTTSSLLDYSCKDPIAK
jgi:hypothetical protein